MPTLGQVLQVAAPIVLAKHGIEDAKPHIFEMPNGGIVIALHLYAKAEISSLYVQQAKVNPDQIVGIAEAALNKLVESLKRLIHP